MSLLALAAIPVKIYSVPGFEITPSLVLAPAALLLFNPREKIHYAVLAFMTFCGFLALAGMVGSAGPLRNLIGAASYSSGAPYILAGMTLARRNIALPKMWRIIAPVAIAMTVIFAIDLYRTNGNLFISSAYSSIAYNADETTYIQSFFPFYGKYAVITLATIAMMIGALSVASAPAFRGRMLRLIVLVVSNALVFIAFSLWSRQVMIGAIIFYAVLIALAFRRKETWISVAVFLVLFAPWAYSMRGLSPDHGASVVSAGAFGNYKMHRSLRDIENGNFGDLSTGRLSIYRNAIGRLTPRIALGGCGFCSLKDVMRFRFSSLHNVILTAIFKGGIVFAILDLGAAFAGLLLLWRLPKSFARDTTLATIASLAFQSMVNDVIYFQIIPSILFTTTGYAWGRTT